MAIDISLINLRDLSKPAVVLIERVSDAVGGIFKPYQIKRVARAEAKADKIRALANIEISDIESRALERLLREEGKKQENIESITAQAAKLLGDDAKPEELEDDWIANFFEKCRIVSDTEMQVLWSKLLAGEATKTGTYSKRTVNFVSSLDKSDCTVFTNLCTFVCNVQLLVPLILDVDDDIYKNHGIYFSVLNHLDDIGLITFQNISGFRLKALPKHVVVTYYGTPIGIELPRDEKNQLELGKVLFTNVGTELAPICGSARSNEFVSYLVKKWTELNLSPFSPLSIRVSGRLPDK